MVQSSDRSYTSSRADWSEVTARPSSKLRVKRYNGRYLKVETNDPLLAPLHILSFPLMQALRTDHFFSSAAAELPHTLERKREREREHDRPLLPFILRSFRLLSQITYHARPITTSPPDSRYGLGDVLTPSILPRALTLVPSRIRLSTRPCTLTESPRSPTAPWLHHSCYRHSIGHSAKYPIDNGRESNHALSQQRARHCSRPETYTMSSLSSSFNTFRNEYSDAASRAAQRKRTDAPASAATPAAPAPTPRASTPAGSAPTTDLKRKRPDVADNATYSQPADKGSGSQVLTQVVYAQDYLKLKDRPVGFNDIWNYLSIPADHQQHRAVLRRALMLNPKIDYDPKGLDGHGSFRFRPKHAVRSAEELKGYLQRQPTAQGISVKDLKEGWPTAITEIEAMERKGELLVTRNKKDNTPKMVWPNDPSLAQHIDQDFQDFWHKVKLPANPSDMRAELEKAGLTPTSQVKETVKVLGAREKKKRISRKVGRSTNTHMTGILKDYTQVKK